MNKAMLNHRYRGLIPYNKEKFVQDVNDLKSSLDLTKVVGDTALIYSDGLREALQYTLCVYNSLKADRLLDYRSVTAYEIREDHFMPSESRDGELASDLNYVDILFIKMSQFDNLNDYVENLLVDIIGFRTDNKKLTYVIYDTMGAPGSPNLAVRKIHKYFTSRGYTIVNLNTKETMASQFHSSKPKVTIDSPSNKEGARPVVVHKRGGKK